MPYIGRNTDKLSNVEVLDNITFDGSQSYTLQKNSVNFTPSSANTILISIDGVVQAGNFTVSGSTIDFGVAVASSSTCDFILHYGVGLITTPADGTITDAKLAASAINSQTAETSIAGGDEVLIYDTSASALRKMTRTNFVSGVGGDNTPAFEAILTSDTSQLSNDTDTKITFNSETYDSDGTYDTSNGRFTPAVAGKYFIYAGVQVNAGGGASDLNEASCQIRKNGSTFRYNQVKYNSNPIQYATVTNQATLDLSVGDYIEIFSHADSASSSSSNSFSGGNNQTYFGAYKIIE